MQYTTSIVTKKINKRRMKAFEDNTMQSPSSLKELDKQGIAKNSLHPPPHELEKM